MATYISDLLRRLFPPTEVRLLCVGLDASGRTSWLYSMVFPGQRITTIPTVGFNVETIDHAGVSITIWDVGGCDKIRPLWRHYFQNTQGLVFFVDSNDRNRLDEVGEELRRLASEEELRGAVVLVIANKQDLPCALSVAEVTERLRLPQVLRDRAWVCLPGCVHDQQATRAHLEWIVGAVRPAATRAPLGPRPAPSASSSAGAGDDGKPAAAAAGGGSGGASAGGGSEPDVLERWLRVEDEPDEEFLRKLEDYSLGVWDHRTHLRLAWLYLSRHGRREGLARIHASIRAFIEHSPLTRRKSGTTYHETMTYFWAHMVHFAIASQKVPPGATPDFRLFLLLNPQLSNGGLFLHYYSKQLMLQSPESRVRVVLPDKRPLPSIVTDLAALSLREESKHTEGAAPRAPPPSTPPSDAEFLDRFLARRLDRWNHECLLRAIYCCLSRHGRRRGGSMALDGLRALQGEGHHTTINYAWLALMTHTLAGECAQALFADRPPAQPAAASAATAAGGVDEGEGASGAGEAAAGDAAGGAARAEGRGAAEAMLLPEWSALLGSGSYASVRVRELIADPERFLKHYSKEAIYSDLAAVQFVPPDKRPLPSTV